MKLMGRHIQTNGPGYVKLICEDAEDMWQLYNIVRVGDHVRSKTFRKVVNESSTGSTTSQRMAITLEVAIETIDFDATECTLHLKGRNVMENQYVKLGAYHTVDLDLDRQFSISKAVWDSFDLERLDEAIDTSKKADVAAVTIQEGLANVCLVTSTMTLVRARIEMPVSRKRKGFTAQHDKSMARFFDAVANAFLRHINYDAMKAIIIAGRGYLRDKFYERLHAIATKENKKLPDEKFILAEASTGYKHAINQVLADPAVVARLSDTRAQAEVKAFNQFMEQLNVDSGKALYGYSHVMTANSHDAIQVLLVSDALFRSNNIKQRKQYINLVESVRSKGREVHIFSSMHVSGEQLNQLTGVAAITFYPLHLDDEDEDVTYNEPVLGIGFVEAVEEIKLEDDE